MPPKLAFFQFQDLLGHPKWCRILFHQPYFSVPNPKTSEVVHAFLVGVPFQSVSWPSKIQPVTGAGIVRKHMAVYVVSLFIYVYPYLGKMSNLSNV